MWSWRPLPTSLHPMSLQLPPRPPSRWRRSLRSPREPLSRGGAVCARWGLPGQCWLPLIWHGAIYPFCLKVPSGNGYSIFASTFCNMIKSTIQPGDGLPVLPQLCCHTFNCSWDLPKDRSLRQCSWCCPGYSFRSSNIDSIGKITEIRKRKFCLKAVFIFQGGQLPPCYEQGDVKICPFSFAKFGDVVFDYTQVGNGFGPYTYNGILLKATYSHS